VPRRVQASGNAGADRAPAPKAQRAKLVGTAAAFAPTHRHCTPVRLSRGAAPASAAARRRGRGAFALNLELVDTARQFASFALDSAPSVRVFSLPLEAMAVTGKSKTGEAGRKALIARADARASQLAPIVAELRRGGVTSWYGIAMALNKRGIPTATGRGIWEPGQVRRVMERLK
jgi:hypothetical protein